MPACRPTQTARKERAGDSQAQLKGKHFPHASEQSLSAKLGQIHSSEYVRKESSVWQRRGYALCHLPMIHAQALAAAQSAARFMWEEFLFAFHLLRSMCDQCRITHTVGNLHIEQNTDKA